MNGYSAVLIFKTTGRDDGVVDQKTWDAIVAPVLIFAESGIELAYLENL